MQVILSGAKCYLILIKNFFFFLLFFSKVNKYISCGQAAEGGGLFRIFMSTNNYMASLEIVRRRTEHFDVALVVVFFFLH